MCPELKGCLVVTGSSCAGTALTHSPFHTHAPVEKQFFQNQPVLLLAAARSFGGELTDAVTRQPTSTVAPPHHRTPSPLANKHGTGDQIWTFRFSCCYHQSLTTQQTACDKAQLEFKHAPGIEMLSLCKNKTGVEADSSRETREKQRCSDNDPQYYSQSESFWPHLSEGVLYECILINLFTF